MRFESSDPVSWNSGEIMPVGSSTVRVDHFRRNYQGFSKESCSYLLRQHQEFVHCRYRCHPGTHVRVKRILHCSKFTLRRSGTATIWQGLFQLTKLIHSRRCLQSNRNNQNIQSFWPDGIPPIILKRLGPILKPIKPSDQRSSYRSFLYFWNVLVTSWNL